MVLPSVAIDCPVSVRTAKSRRKGREEGRGWREEEEEGRRRRGRRWEGRRWVNSLNVAG